MNLQEDSPNQSLPSNLLKFEEFEYTEDEIPDEDSPLGNFNSNRNTKTIKPSPLVKNKGSIKLNEIKGFLDDLKQEYENIPRLADCLKMTKKMSTPNFCKVFRESRPKKKTRKNRMKKMVKRSITIPNQIKSSL
mmetsp:Transcript_6246/g.5368  ORF Transcript_6246/g.5368 Transcript_6246/m.5368 type:complete len:134 (+) Transcript_6246:2-403(+)